MRFIIACIKTAIEFNKAMDKYQKLYDEIDFDKYICPFKYKE